MDNEHDETPEEHEAHRDISLEEEAIRKDIKKERAKRERLQHGQPAVDDEVDPQDEAAHAERAEHDPAHNDGA